MNSEWTIVDELAAALAQHLGSPPELVVVLGSGLSDALPPLVNVKTVSFDQLPGWPRSTVSGHAGKLVAGDCEECRVLFQLGRVHLYEGYTPAEVVRPVRAAITYGARHVLLTNAAGGINEYLKSGHLMLVEDHLNLTGQNPLVGVNDERRGPRFPDMTDAYCRTLRALMIEAASTLEIDFKIGVYAGLTGPSYETPAEVGMLRRLGADAVGMSTVLETIAANHLGARVGAISVISNAAASAGGAKLSHNEVKEAALAAGGQIGRLVEGLAARLGQVGL